MKYRITTKNGRYRVEYEGRKWFSRQIEWRPYYIALTFSSFLEAKTRLDELFTIDEPWVPVTDAT